ncbi:hypothetical protein BN8_05198 [Fibrisoma limi BUZ 3]|uniref:Ig-like domain-containing protein n=2 Tax=Fibrisoma limi TaxID=663275 RepID=I2GPS2_9BACT|nr:hypothetical protein BN8_05198 [Fibrisoma limi BUZ 3]
MVDLLTEVNYCLLDPAVIGYRGQNNLTTDPRFVDAANGNLQLLACSPAINTGTGSGRTTTDLANYPRVQGGRIDLGAYEYQGVPGELTLTASATPINICTGQETKLSATASGLPGPIIYNWYSPSGATLSNATTNPTTATITQTGLQSFTVTASASGCKSTTTVTVTGLQTPQAPTLTSSVTASCGSPLSVTASCLTGNVSWQATGGIADGNVYTVSQPGTYSISARCQNTEGCTSPPAPSVSLILKQLTITQFPDSQTACVGSDATFAVQASGPQGLTYAWFKNSADPNQPVLATTPSYNVSVNEGSKAGRYIVRVSAEGCTSQQAEARLTVNQRPVAPAPTSTKRQFCASESPVELSQFINRTNSSYKLRYATAEGQTLAGSQVVLNQPGNFAYQVSQLDPSTGCESVPTRFTLTVNATTQLVSAPANQSVCSGSDVTLLVQASGSNLKYEWFRSSISNQNKLAENPSKQTGTSTASLKLIKVSQSQSYYVRISGDCGVISSGPVQVTVQACGARQGIAEAGSGLQVKLLGNPVEGKNVEVEVRGVAGQLVELRLVDAQGKLVAQQRINRAEEFERISMPVGQGGGIFFLDVHTAHERQQMKVLIR